MLITNRVLAAVFILVFTSAKVSPASGQAGQAAQPASAPENYTTVELKPSSGFLSAGKYTNAYFGFSLPLPQDPGIDVMDPSRLTPMLTSVMHAIQMPDSARIWVLFGLIKRGQGRSSVMVMAKEVKDADKEERQDAAAEKAGAKRIVIGGQNFLEVPLNLFRARLPYQGTVYTTLLRGYRLVFQVGCSDCDSMEAMDKAVRGMIFFEPAKAAEMAGPGSHRFGQNLPLNPTSGGAAENSTGELNLGMVVGNKYENKTLGLSYELPAGWANSGASDNFQGKLGMGLKFPGAVGGVSGGDLYRWSCLRLLVDLRKSGAVADAENGAEITLATFDPACKSGAKFPASVDDQAGIEDVSSATGTVLGRGHGVQAENYHARALSVGGQVMVELSGTWDEGDAGAGHQKTYVALDVVRDGNYWVEWFFKDSSEAELEKVKGENIRFTLSNTEPRTKSWEVKIK
jgi:hypothetical protein